MINNLIGWLMFAVSLAVYTMTLEPSVSLWDCGEFISASDKLQVVHPPGAPLFLLVGRIFSMFASEPSGVAFAVNMLSAISSALTVLFTFWITTHFAKKIVKPEEGSTTDSIAIFGSGIIAALALTFMDSFWFSAVEAEVYAMSSFFTALTFWAMLKWEESNSVYADKWIVLIAYLIGLAIGTHLLNLLVIPAIVFIYYFKKSKNHSNQGMVISFLVGMVILFFIQKGIIPGVPKLMAIFDRLFVNNLGMSFNSGAMFALFLIISITAFGIYYFSTKDKRPYFNLAFICLAYILLGYSSYAMVVVRSNDNPAIDMNNPEEPNNLVSYINREQYGDRPLLKGPYFNAKPVGIIEGATIYRKDSNAYTAIGNKREYEYDPYYNTFFPRMGDMNKDGGEAGYRYWGNMSDVENEINALQQEMQRAQSPEDKSKIQGQIEDLKAQKPKMSNNLAFLFRYQLGHMYFRYFMWNFAGRQNDKQGHSFNHNIEGAWISGIPIVDNMRLGPQDGMPEHMAKNPAKNKYYFLPLILGVLGLILHFKKSKNDAIITMTLFIFTGILIIIFLNQPPFEPRERDYSHVGSFQTFCIWIGLGVLFIWDWLKSKMNATSAAVLASIISLSAPVIMGTQGWDDHDRSDRYLGIDFARNYLESCPKNAILFTNGDNDTYPLWYAQNVEGIRTDIRIINQSLLPTDWYSQVLLTKVYNSEPLPLTLTKDQLAAGVNEYFQLAENPGAKTKDLRTFIKELTIGNKETYDVTNFTVPVNKQAAIREGVVRLEDTALIQSQMVINFPRRGMSKGDLVVLDLVATNAATGWKRPICFTTTSGNDGFLNMEPYFERKGLIFQLTPIRSQVQNRDVQRMDMEGLYINLMTKYKFSGMKEKKNFFLDDKAEIVPSTMQQLFVSLAANYLGKIEELKAKDSTLSLPENKEKANEYRKKAENLLNKCSLEIPETVLLTKGNIKFGMAQVWHEIGNKQQAEKHLKELYDLSQKEVRYFIKFSSHRAKQYIMQQYCNDSYDYMRRCAEYAKQWGFTKLAESMDKEVKELETTVVAFLNTED